MKYFVILSLLLFPVTRAESQCSLYGIEDLSIQEEGTPLSCGDAYVTGYQRL